jgi:hypothetical protein
MQQYIVIFLLLATWLVTAMSQKENLINPADPAAKARCVKLAGKPTWGKFYFRRRLANGKCPRGWEGTWCADGMGKQYQNKQCRRKQRVPVPAPAPQPAAVVEMSVPSAAVDPVVDEIEEDEIEEDDDE